MPILPELIAVLDLATVGYWTLIVATVAFAIGLVIFVHELGHFLVARACGVKCDKFMVGFDVGGLKLSRRWGETEYGIGIIPLGGYVKMLGQGDDPAQLAEQMKQSQIDAASADAVPVTAPNGDTYYVDRRSYLAKSVPQRMAIISAGVVMNIIFAFIFAVIAYGMGVKYIPSIVSDTVPGSPAWQAGLEPGDEIVQIANRQDPTFMQLRGSVTLGDLEDGIPILVRRAADGVLEPKTLTPTQEAGRLATVGVTMSQSLTLAEELPFRDHSPAARAKLLTPTADSQQPTADSQQPTAETPRGLDRIIRVGDAPVESYRQFAAELARGIDQPLRVTVERPVKKRDAMRRAADAPQTDQLTFEVQPQPLHELGLVMTMGPITAVRQNSPASAAGLKEGDVIEAVDGQPLASAQARDGLDPLHLPEHLRQAALEEREVELAVRRPAGDGERLTLTVRPAVPDFMHGHIPEGAPMVAEALGIAYRIENQVQRVRSGGPAEASDIAPGDTVIAAKVIFPKPADGKSAEPPVTIDFEADGPGWLATQVRRLFGREVPARQPLPNWPALIGALQFVPEGTEVELTLRRDQAVQPYKVKLAPQPADGLFVAQRGFVFDPVTRVRKAETFAAQIRYGGEETAQALTMVFRFLQKLGTQVPVTALGGPVTIAKAAGYSAIEGLPTLLIFLTILSANLAIINFLPIPVLDGGHMVFLAYEGIRGRPASERFVIALHTAGFLFIVSLMLFVLALDFGLIPRNL